MTNQYRFTAKKTLSESTIIPTNDSKPIWGDQPNIRFDLDESPTRFEISVGRSKRGS
jgi:hypothetical protein